jgi:hypothetical protein
MQRNAMKKTITTPGPDATMMWKRPDKQLGTAGLAAARR